MRALIVKLSALGDVVQSFPVLTFLVSPGWEVDWLVGSSAYDLVSAHPDVGTVFCQDEKIVNHYDLLIDLQGNIKSAFHTLRLHAKEKVGFGYSTCAEWPNILSTRYRYNPSLAEGIHYHYLDLVAQHLQLSLPTSLPTVTLCCDSIALAEAEEQFSLWPRPHDLLFAGSRWPNKEVPVDLLVRYLKRECNGTLFLGWGSDQERSQAEEIVAKIPEAKILSKRHPLPLLQNLMKGRDRVIAMDSLPLHLAASAGCPTLSFFGASSAACYAPRGSIHHSLQGVCPYGERFTKRCSKLRRCPTGACMDSFSFD